MTMQRFEAASLRLMYHGSPWSNVSFRSNRTMMYFTDDVKVATDYALGRKAFTGKNNFGGTLAPTVYKVQVGTDKVFDMRNSAHRTAYEERRLTYNAGISDPDGVAPRINSEGFVSRATGCLTFGYAGLIYDMFTNQFDGVWLDESSYEISLCLFKTAGHVRLITEMSVQK